MTTEKTYAVIGCPWLCEEAPTLERWHGGGPQKHRISCDNDCCDIHPSVTGNTAVGAVKLWNGNRTGTVYHIKVTK